MPSPGQSVPSTTLQALRHSLVFPYIALMAGAQVTDVAQATVGVA